MMMKISNNSVQLNSHRFLSSVRVLHVALFSVAESQSLSLPYFVNNKALTSSAKCIFFKGNNSNVVNMLEYVQDIFSDQTGEQDILAWLWRIEKELINNCVRPLGKGDHSMIEWNVKFILNEKPKSKPGKI